MLSSIVRFELRYQLRNPVFWGGAVIFFVLTFASMVIDQVHIGSGANVHKNSPYAITQVTQIMSLFYMFVTTAFAANIVLRDSESGFGPLIYTSRVKRFDYLFGRFLGAFAICVLGLASVPLAIFFGSLMPWVDPDTLGPNRAQDYLFAFGVFGIPTVFFTAAIFSGAATLTRSMMASYLTATALFIGYSVAAVAASKPDWAATFAWFDPFGLGTFQQATKYWTPIERNSQLPNLTGALLVSRLIWIAVGFGMLAVTYALFRVESKGVKAGAAKESDSAPPPVRQLALPRTGWRTDWAIFRLRLWFEMRAVFTSPAYFALLILGIGNCAPTLWVSGDIFFGTPILPVTRVMIAGLEGAYAFFAIIIAIYYGGEMVWRERERRIHEIIDATPIPDWAYMVPKTVAIGLVLCSTLVVSILVAIVIQAVRGGVEFEIGKYALWYLLPWSIDCFLYAVLSVFVQSLVPHKFIGWGVMLLFLISTATLTTIGFEHNLYQYAGHPTVPLSDMNGMGRFWEGAYWYRLYWCAFGLALLVASHLLWRRGVEVKLRPRLARLPVRLKGRAGVAMALCLVVFVTTGIWIFHNTNQLNHYVTTEDDQKFQADAEKALLPFETLAQPSVVSVTLAVELFPPDRHAHTIGSYVLENQTAEPIADIHVRSAERWLTLDPLTIDGASRDDRFKFFNYFIFHLDKPMAPGEKRVLRFASDRVQAGFMNSADQHRIVDNGSFLNNIEIAPQIGMNRQGALQNRVIRRKYGLPPELKMAELGDPKALNHNYVGVDWTLSDITLTTDADQTPIAPGEKVSDHTENGRRTARFVSTIPILNFFSLQSARYQEKKLSHDDIDLTVYYDAQHPANVDRMLNAMAGGLDYNQANFSPYQFRQARIIEFPAYETFAQAFANTIPFSEGIGFIADFRDPDRIDYATYVTGHEIAHQWWAHQVVGADMQGATLMSETLAQYSAIMLMEKLYGPDQMRRFLKYELDRYLRSRGTEQTEEAPLVRVDMRQGYVHYNKGSLAMYLLRDRIGEDKVNSALSKFVQHYRFKGAPYPMSTDFLSYLRAEAPPQDQDLITDLFEKITLVDLKAKDASVTKRADGRFDVSVTVEAHKFYADGKGKETEAPLDEPIDIGLFTAEPGKGKFTSDNVIQMGRQQIRTGEQRLSFTVDKRPTHVGVDPYNKWIDRNSDDNVVKVGS